MFALTLAEEMGFAVLRLKTKHNIRCESEHCALFDQDDSI